MGGRNCREWPQQVNAAGFHQLTVSPFAWGFNGLLTTSLPRFSPKNQADAGPHTPETPGLRQTGKQEVNHNGKSIFKIVSISSMLHVNSCRMIDSQECLLVSRPSQPLCCVETR